MDLLVDDLFADADGVSPPPPRPAGGPKNTPAAPPLYATGRLSQAQLMPSPPMPVPPAALFNRLLDDLGFSAGPALCTMLDTWNEDLFSGFPTNADMYRECKFLSTLPSDVIDWGDAHVPERSPIDIRAHGDVAFPTLPATRDELPSYYEAMAQFFRGELRAREESYRTVLANFCSALYRYLRASVRQLHRQAHMRGRNRDLREMLRTTIADRYYRETARLARVLFLHLYLFLSREILWAAYAEQMMRPDLFDGLCCDLESWRQLACLFQPLMFINGSLTVRGVPVEARRLRELNHIREHLNLPLVRSAAAEEPGAPLTTPPVLQGNQARSSGYFMLLIRAKLDSYSSVATSEGESVMREHAYSRGRTRNNYGSTIEGLLDLPDDDNAPAEAGLVAPRMSFLSAGQRPRRLSTTAPITDVSLGDELRLDGEEVDMTPADALDDFDLEMLGDVESPSPGMTHDPVSYGALDVDDFEFEQMFTDAMGIDDFGG
uniref:Tegument protein VP16 n=1 Tax=Human herpesvirus 2 TaxID=10310 RepID=A0A481TAW7_HHV2|nr:UL48 [Human alphaherpesvirus 2]